MRLPHFPQVLIASLLAGTPSLLVAPTLVAAQEPASVPTDRAGLLSVQAPTQATTHKPAPASPRTPSLAPTEAASAPQAELRVSIRNLEPRVYDNQGNLKVTVEIENHTKNYLPSTTFTLLSTAERINRDDLDSKWLNVNAKDLPEPATKTLSGLTLPGMFPGQKSQVVVDVAEHLAQQAFSEPGTYGLIVNFSARPSLVTSAAAQRDLKLIKDVQSSSSGASRINARVVKLSGSTFEYQALSTLPTSTQGAEAGCPDCELAPEGSPLSTSARSITARKNNNNTIQLVNLVNLHMEASERSQEVPAIAALNRTKRVLQLANEQRINLVLDPAMLQVNTIQAPNPAYAANLTKLHFRAEYKLEEVNPDNPNEGGSPETTTPEPSADSAIPSTVELGSPEGESDGRKQPAVGDQGKPKDSEPQEASSTITPDRATLLERINVEAKRSQGYQRSLSELLPDLEAAAPNRLAMTPWGNPNWSLIAFDNPQTKLLSHTSLISTNRILKQLNEPASTPEPLPDPQDESIGVGAFNPTVRIIPLAANDVASLKTHQVFRNFNNGQNLALVESNQVVDQQSGVLNLDLDSKLQPAIVVDSQASDYLSAASESQDPGAAFAYQQAFRAVANEHSGILPVRCPGDAEAFEKCARFLNGFANDNRLESLDFNQLNTELLTKPIDSVTLIDPVAEAKDPQVAKDFLSSVSAVIRVAQALDRPMEMLDPIAKSGLLQIARTSDLNKVGLDTWKRSLQPYLEAFRITAPKNVLMIYGVADLQVGVDNTLPWPAHAKLSLLSSHARLQSYKATETGLPASTLATVPVELNAVGSGDTPATLILSNLQGQELARFDDLVINVRADWETTGVITVGAISAAVLIFGIAKRVRKGRRVTPEDIAEARRYHLGIKEDTSATYSEDKS
ncbi:DUF6049 family protein [Boudabousia liubingyangii]|uniref:DUF6049 family protein n=1 Tax=Boudabousia liubingyangii TaxID=1921764 RepID=UPI000ABA1027|nr:DUF6049 family protein [Boudabousia liubingyangii]